MSLANIRTQMKTILAGVTGIGVVHDYERFSRDATSFASFFVSAGKVNGWTITREAASAEYGSVTDLVRKKHRMMIRGFYALNDANASEKTFQDLIESIFTVFKANTDLNGLAEVEDTDLIQVEDVSHRMLGEVLCHYCELNLIVTERIIG